VSYYFFEVSSDSSSLISFIRLSCFSTPRWPFHFSGGRTPKPPILAEILRTFEKSSSICRNARGQHILPDRATHLLGGKCCQLVKLEARIEGIKTAEARLEGVKTDDLTVLRGEGGDCSSVGEWKETGAVFTGRDTRFAQSNI